MTGTWDPFSSVIWLLSHKRQPNTTYFQAETTKRMIDNSETQLISQKIAPNRVFSMKNLYFFFNYLQNTFTLIFHMIQNNLFHFFHFHFCLPSCSIKIILSVIDRTGTSKDFQDLNLIQVIQQLIFRVIFDVFCNVTNSQIPNL